MISRLAVNVNFVFVSTYPPRKYPIHFFPSQARFPLAQPALPSKLRHSEFLDAPTHVATVYVAAGRTTGFVGTGAIIGGPHAPYRLRSGIGIFETPLPLALPWLTSPLNITTITGYTLARIISKP